MLKRIKNEPALVTALIVALFNLFGVSADIQQTWLKIVTVLLPIVLGFVTRQSVTPLAKMVKPNTPRVTK